MHDLDRIQAEFENSLPNDNQHGIATQPEVDLEDDEFELESEPFEDDHLADSFYDLEDFDDDPAGLGTDASDEDTSDEDNDLDEAEEFELAAELLAATDEEELETAVRKIVRPRPTRARVRRKIRSVRRTQARSGSSGRDDDATGRADGRGSGSGPTRRGRPARRQKKRRSFIGRALKGIAKKALPVLGGAIGSVVAPGVGTAAGQAIGKGIGKAFGLELEGLSPEDAQFEVARQIVRLGAAAGDESDHIDAGVDDEAAARVSVIRASAKHAPGVVPRQPISRHVLRAAGVAQSGRWVRRDGHIVLLGL